jgi:hypothetical protein
MKEPIDIFIQKKLDRTILLFGIGMKLGEFTL